MTDKLPAWAIAQALSEWRDAIPESTFREEVHSQVMARAREILARSTGHAIDPLAVLRGEQYATREDVCRAWMAERAATSMEHAP